VIERPEEVVEVDDPGFVPASQYKSEKVLPLMETVN
jgi:hypothetical protein